MDGRGRVVGPEPTDRDRICLITPGSTARSFRDARPLPQGLRDSCGNGLTSRLGCKAASWHQCRCLCRSRQAFHHAPLSTKRGKVMNCSVSNRCTAS
ncbi:hypothetical protein F9Z43_09250 [Pseudomonas monteilii]|uniref:Uncharacterized protein n=1 Tax=Pseudomonas monteilii TaxID=76759 RepID=A0A6G6UGT5_9PSED|nr:hypothetical protein [Pseudomonas monteilii]QIG17980.1 hypothetical protein FY041_09470 [Pseudomonas monteilii]QIG23237.1 hypothetical protein FY043_09465 [Pseudomonas monteilii]